MRPLITLCMLIVLLANVQSNFSSNLLTKKHYQTQKIAVEQLDDYVKRDITDYKNTGTPPVQRNLNGIKIVPEVKYREYTTELIPMLTQYLPNEQPKQYRVADLPNKIKEVVLVDNVVKEEAYLLTGAKKANTLTYDLSNLTVSVVPANTTLTPSNTNIQFVTDMKTYCMPVIAREFTANGSSLKSDSASITVTHDMSTNTYTTEMSVDNLSNMRVEFSEDSTVKEINNTQVDTITIIDGKQRGTGYFETNDMLTITSTYLPVITIKQLNVESVEYRTYSQVIPEQFLRIFV